jgi:hypothetical protein
VASLGAVRDALAAAIQSNAIPELTCYAQPLDQITPPCALIMPSRTNVAKFGICLGEGLVNDAGNPLTPAEFNLDILIIVAHASTTERVQQTLDQWLGYESGIDPDTGNNVVSVPFAVAIDPTLGGNVDFCECNNVISYGPIDYNGTPYFGARISVVVSTQ